jgi:hypothetical protein
MHPAVNSVPVVRFIIGAVQSPLSLSPLETEIDYAFSLPVIGVTTLDFVDARDDASYCSW